MVSVSDLRKYKLGENVLFDFISTLLGAVILSHFIKVPLVIVTVVLLILGEILHYWFRVPSNTMKYFGLL